MANIYITWHYTTHGVAYLKHVLSAFYRKDVDFEKEAPIDAAGLNQTELNRVFDEQEQGVRFDNVYYLYVPESVIHKITDRRFRYRKHMYERDEMIQEAGTTELWREVIEQRLDSMQEELDYVEKHHPEKLPLFEEQLWRDMQHYRVEEQLWWWHNKSNAKDKYNERRFRSRLLDTMSDLRDEKQLVNAVYKQLNDIVKTHGKDSRYFINVSLGSNETQVAWFVLAEAGKLPPNTRFLKTYDDKSDTSVKRFKPFFIKEVKPTLLSDINRELRIYENMQSPKRKLAQLKMDAYRKMGFAILILGERGTGKSRLVERLEKQEKEVFSVNCAAFDDDNKAESELFGYEKGAFTGADKATKGLFEEAKGGMLFFDEVHHLSKRVQGKLMKALQTDSENKYRYRRLGGTKERITKFTAIFASNLPLDQLKEALLPDFFDRIAQLIIELPSLRETKEELEADWKAIWAQLKFEKAQLPKDARLLTWLRGQPLYGNFRDLQKIAVYYKSYLDFSEEIKDLETATSPFEYAKEQFQRFYQLADAGRWNPALLDYLLDYRVLKGKKEKASAVLEKRFKCLLAHWVDQEHGRKDAPQRLGISDATFYNWLKDKDKEPPSLTVR